MSALDWPLAQSVRLASPAAEVALVVARPLALAAGSASAVEAASPLEQPFEERLAAEMESARTVQQVLVPNEIPPVPGFAIHCVYKPAGQVGGDFFQVMPLPSGGVLIAVGDVSGKGMPAAMTVSLLVETFRTLARYTKSIRDSGLDESPYVVAQPGWFYDLHRSAYRATGSNDCTECRASRSLSGRKGNRR